MNIKTNQQSSSCIYDIYFMGVRDDFNPLEYFQFNREKETKKKQF